MSYRPVSDELKANIAEDLAVGCTFSDIAGRYGVSFSTIRRIKNAIPTAAPLNEQKKSPEAPTPMENASEDITISGSPADTNIITEVPENVKRVPESVLTVVAREISDIEDEIETLTERIDRLRADKSEMEKWYFDNISIGRFYKGSGQHELS